MENSPENNPAELEGNAEFASDEEMVDKLIAHITQPCKTEVDGTIHDTGDFYIREAKS